MTDQLRHHSWLVLPEVRLRYAADTNSRQEMEFVLNLTVVAWEDCTILNVRFHRWDWTDSNPLVTAPYGTRAQKNATLIDVWQQDEVSGLFCSTMRFRSTTKVLATRMLNYYSVS